MALTKIKLDEVDTKATPVLADSILISDSEDDGRGKISTLTDLQTLIGGGGGGGAVDSVAGKTGDVTLDADDVSPTASKLWMSDTQSAKLTGIAENANNYTHPETHPQSMIEGLADALAGKAPIASPALTGTPTAPTAAVGTSNTQIATTGFVRAATARAIYDLPVTRSGLVSDGTDVVLLETGVLDPAWYDETHVLNVSFFARNDSGTNTNTTFKVQLYDEGNSTAHTIASITAVTVGYQLSQASIYRASSPSVNCNIQYGYVSKSGYVSLTAGAYKLRVVCTSTLSTIFEAAQVRFTK